MKIDIINIDTKNMKLIGINKKLVAKIVFNVFKTIFINNFQDILKNKKENTIFLILKKCINQKNFYYLQKEIKKYANKNNLNLKLVDFINLFFDDTSLFNLLIDKKILKKILNKKIKQQDFFEILNINDFIYYKEENYIKNNFDMFMKWKIK